MASTIQLKSGTGSAVPSSLTQGEVAINIDNGLIYYGSGSGNNVKQLREFSSITASAGISASGDIKANNVEVANSLDVEGDIGANGSINGDGATDIDGINTIEAGSDITSGGTVSGQGILGTAFVSGSKGLFENNIHTIAGSGSFTHSVTTAGHITASGEISASSGIFTTADINGGTVDGITSLTAGGDLDIGAHDLRAATLTADGLTSGRVVFAGTNGVLSDDADITFSTDTLTVTKIANVNSTTHVTASSGIVSASGVITTTLEGNGSTTAFVVDGYISSSGYINTLSDITASGAVSASGGFIGNLTGQAATVATITGLAPDTATTQAAQGNITSLGTLTSLTVSGDINANGNIVGDDSTDITNIETIECDNVVHDGDTDTKMSFGTDTISFLAQDKTNLVVNNSGSLRTFHSSSVGPASGSSGDVIYFGGTTSLDSGKIYHFKSDGTWEIANPNAAATSDGLLAVALGDESDVDGMLLRGMVTLDHDPGAVGDVLYLDASNNGQASATVPSGDEDIVRVIGYCLDASNHQIWFNPDNTFVEVNA